MGAVVGLMDAANALDEPGVLDRPSRRRPGLARVVGARRDAERPADRLDPEAIAMRVDEAHLFGRVGSSSVAKALAAFRISFARRSSRFSRSSSFRRSRSAMVSRSLRRPASASAARTQRRSVSRCTPRSRAMCAIGRPDSNTSRTPRSRSSGGYLRGAGNDGASPLPSTDHPGLGASTEPGTAQWSRAWATRARTRARRRGK
jgi:hypothetical protein